MRDVVLESIDAREAALLPRLHLVVNAPLLYAQRLQLAAAIVNNADGRSKSQLDRAPPNRKRILRMVNATANHRINVHVKIGVLSQQLQLLIQNLQTLLRNLVRIHVINRNLQPLESSPVEPLDALGDKQISVSDQPRNHSMAANAPDYVIKLRMQQRLATGNRNHSSAQRPQLVNAAEHFLRRHGLRKIVKLVAVSASQIAPPHRNNVREKRMVG